MSIAIPMDIYESTQELVVIIPLSGVSHKSIRISLENYVLHVSGTRVLPKLKDTLEPVQQECYRGDFEQEVQLPNAVYFDKIHSKLTPDNILLIVVPKYIVPEQMNIDIQR